MSTSETDGVRPISHSGGAVEPYSWNKNAVRDARTGRIVGRGDLNTRQKRFVTMMIETGGNVTLAAKLSGYAAPASSGMLLIQNPLVLEAISAGRTRALESLACRAVGVLREVMDDTGAPASARVQAAKLSLALVGHSEAPPAAQNPLPGTGVPLDSLSVDALESFVSGGIDAIRRLRPVIEAQAIEKAGIPGPS